LHTPLYRIFAPLILAQHAFENVRFQPLTLPQTGFQVSLQAPAARALSVDDKAMPVARRPASSAVVETIFPSLVIFHPLLKFNAEAG
jgi:hypothetical protein